MNFNQLKYNQEIIKKERNAGIDLLKIIGMFAIIIDHILIHGKLFKKFNNTKELYLLLTFCFWHVNSFALVSGVVGFKRHKYSNLLNLWFCVLFYSISIFFIFKIIYFPLKYYKLSELFFPVIYRKYWYFTDYFSMYLFIPIINRGILYLSKSELKIIIWSLLLLFIIIKDIINPQFNTLNLNSGYSLLWLLILYIIGAFLGKYIIKIKKKNKFFYIINMAVFICSSLLSYYLTKKRIKKFKFIKHLFKRRYNSFAMTLQVISLSLFISHIKYNKYLSKIISFFGPLTFGVYLIHDNKLVRKYIIESIFKKYSSNLENNFIIYLVLIRGLQVLIICLIIDYFRYILFKILKIRQLCVIIEKYIMNF